jgi:hypothetical protein
MSSHLMCNLAITMNCCTKFDNFILEKYITKFNHIILIDYTFVICITTLCLINNYVLLIVIKGRVNVITFQTFIVII